MSAVMGTPYSPPSPPATSSSATMSPTMSPIYPDRPIRPLPKRSLRERMSSEAPDKTSSHPMAHYPRKSSTYVPYSKTIAERDGPMMRNVLSEINRAIPQAQKQMAEEEKAAYRFRGNEINSEEEGDDDDIGVNYRHQDSSRRGNGTIKGHHYDAEKSHSASSNDSADGYESFENTNNKKKRKIPTSGNLPASMSASLSQDLANMGISNDEESVDRADDGVSHYYSTGTGVNLNGNGISSAARGRYGKPSRRDTPGRVPLHSSMNAPNVWPNGKSSGSKSKSEMKAESSKGIISQAIADAAALQNITSQGRENVSLLEQQSQKKSSNVNSHFTFTYESESSSKPVWPKDNISMGIASPASQPGSVAQGNRQDHGVLAPPPGIPIPTQPAQDAQDNHLHDEAPRKPRRSASKRHALAAKERRSQQEYNNYQHPPKEEDFWVCQFCDYESIFGRPPEALIRQYETKDEKERQRQAEKRRLLEKAKMKGRKGKKGKGQGKGGNTVTNPVGSSQPAYDPLIPGDYPAYGHPEDTYYEDDYDEPGPTPAPSPENLPQRTHSINQNPGQNVKTAPVTQGSKESRRA